MNFDDKVITLENKKQYLIIETVEYENKIYAYLMNKNEELDAIFREIGLDNKLKEIDKNLFEKNIFPLFLQKFENYE